MLSIGPLSEGQGRYYLELANGDYYQHGGEPPGRWQGTGASRLGLTGTVEAEPFFHLLYGLAPDGRSSLVGRQPGRAHHPGWDLTFSVPKGVSVLWALGDEATRQTVQACHHAATAAALGLLQAEAAISRRGKGGRRREAADLVVAEFQHGTSRAQDPQLHSHCVVLNVGVLADGRTGALAGQLLYRWKMAAGAVYRAELAARLRRELGVALEAHGTAFELADVPERIRRVFSKRREAILEALAARGLHSARAAATATLATRTPKTHRPRAELLAAWQSIGAELGFGADEVRELARQRPLTPAQAKLAGAQCAAQAVDHLTLEQNYFSLPELIRRTAEQGAPRGVGAGPLLAASRATLARPDVRPVGTWRDQPVYTTQTILDLEEALFAAAGRLAAPTVGGGLSSLARRGSLSEWGLAAEQAKALDYLLSGNGRLALVDGLAGTGKTKLLLAARRAWTKAGYTVLGTAVSGRAALGLQQASGIPSCTVAELILRLGGGPAEGGVGHHLRMLGRAAVGQSTWRPGEVSLTLDAKTVLVLDEASMVSTADLAFLVDAVDRAGAKLVALGDRAQLPAIANGGGFAALVDRFGGRRLTGIRRQREAWAREAVRALADGDVAAALREHAERGLVTVARDRAAAQARLIEAWSAGGVRRPREHVILAATREEAATLNRLAQERRRQAGLLGEAAVRVNGSLLRVGDRVLLTRNHRTLGVVNGDTGTVLLVSPLTGNVVVKLDRRERFRVPRIVGLPLLRYQHVELGYALTTHKAQGSTYEHTYLLAGGLMQSRELGYVQMSRGRAAARLFLAEQEAGPQLTDLARQLERRQAQSLATVTQQQAADGRRRQEQGQAQPVAWGKAAARERLLAARRERAAREQERQPTARTRRPGSRLVQVPAKAVVRVIRRARRRVRVRRVWREPGR